VCPGIHTRWQKPFRRQHPGALQLEGEDQTQSQDSGGSTARIQKILRAIVVVLINQRRASAVNVCVATNMDAH